MIYRFKYKSCNFKHGNCFFLDIFLKRPADISVKFEKKERNKNNNDNNNNKNYIKVVDFCMYVIKTQHRRHIIVKYLVAQIR